MADLARLSGRMRGGEALPLPEGPEPSPLAGLMEGLRGQVEQAGQMTQRPFHSPGGIDQAAGGALGLVGTLMMPGDVPGPLARLLSRVRNPASLTRGDINKGLDSLEAEASRLNNEFLAAGRGSERPSETRLLTDPLARRSEAIQDALAQLRSEIRQRYGPGGPTGPPSRLPHGVGIKARTAP